MHQETPPSKVASNDQLGHADETRCMCKDRALSACPGEWAPGCDLGNNPAHAWPAPAVLDTTDSEVLREALAVAWGDSMTAQLKNHDQAAEIARLRAAGLGVVVHMDGRQPVRGWLKDTDKSRDALAELVRVLGA